MARPEDRWFVRWRTAGDAEALARVHDVAAPALLRIAMHHARHPSAAEDLVQATFLAAIEGADGYDPARPLLGWLVGILHNQAKWMARREARAVDADRLSERRVADPLAAAQAAEFTAQVDEGIAQLPEVYRPVLRLHLAHELDAAEIAHALERPPGTVRSQITRGLELLRAALPAGTALAAFAVLTPARGAAAMRDAVLAAGRAHVTAATAGSAGGATFTTTMGTKKVLLGAACVLVCAAGAWIAGSAVVGADAALRPAASSHAPAATTPAEFATAREAPRDEASREAVAAVGPSWRLAGTVSGADRQGVAGARVRVRQCCERTEELLAEVLTAADGCYVVDLGVLRELPPIDLDRVALVATVEAPGHVSHELRPDLPHRDPARELALVADARMEIGAIACGRVVDAMGCPVAGAEVALHAGGQDDARSPGSTRTGADGCFRIAGEATSTATLRAEHVQYGAAERAFELVSGRDAVVPDLVLRPRSMLRARVTFADGEPAVGIAVEVGVPGASSSRTMATDREGRIAVRTLAAGRYECTVNVVCGNEPSALVETDGDEVPIVLHDAHLVRFAFADEAGRRLRPLDVAYEVWPAEHGAAVAASAAEGRLPDRMRGCVSGAGAVSSELVGTGAWVRVSADHRDAHGEAMLQVGPPRNVHDEVLTLRERLRNASLRVHVAAADGGALGPVECRLRPLQLGVPGTSEFLPEARSGDLVARWYAGRYRLEVKPGWNGREFGWFATFDEQVVLAGERETVCEHTLSVGGRVRLVVHAADPADRGDIADFAVHEEGADAQPLNRHFVRMHADGWTMLGSAPAGEPLVWMPVLSPGRHELVLRSRDHRDARIAVVIAPRALGDVEVFLQAR